MGAGLRPFIRGLVIVVLLVGAAAAMVALKRYSDSQGERPDAQTVVDEPSGISWEMYGTPKVTTTSADLVLDRPRGGQTEVRIYSVDHGEWVERVQIFDAPPTEVDVAPAAISTFGDPVTGELAGLEFIEVGGFDGAMGAVDGLVVQQTQQREVTTQVFAAQVGDHVVAGGIAQRSDAPDAEVDLVADAEALRSSVSYSSGSPGAGS